MKTTIDYITRLIKEELEREGLYPSTSPSPALPPRPPINFKNESYRHKMMTVGSLERSLEALKTLGDTESYEAVKEIRDKIYNEALEWAKAHPYEK